MALIEELVVIERQLWTGDAERYRAIVDERCLMALTQLARVMTRAQVAETVSDSPRWGEPEIRIKGLLEIGEVAILSYEARAVRATDQQPYGALVSSGYVRRPGGWKLAFHQQTPLG